MKRHQKKFAEILDLLIKRFGERLRYDENEGTTYLSLTDSDFWMSSDSGELVVGYGFNHTHYSDGYGNLDVGLVQIFDLLTNEIKTTN